MSGTRVALTAATYSSSIDSVVAGSPEVAAFAATSPARARERSAKLMPSRVHGSSSPAASPATITFPLRTGTHRSCIG
jgi:hypothetical protein